MRPVSGRAARAALQTFFLGLALSVMQMHHASAAHADGSNDEPPRYNPAELKKLNFKPAKGEKELRARDRLLANAQKALAPGDFDKFMNDVNAMEDKVRRGKAKGRVDTAHNSEALSADGIPLEVEFDGGDNPAVQKTSEFFAKPSGE